MHPEVLSLLRSRRPAELHRLVLGAVDPYVNRQALAAGTINRTFDINACADPATAPPTRFSATAINVVRLDFYWG
ncbi:hypothetical protein ACWCQZ_46145 [Streptomyces sp. NPDC002285]